MVNMRPRVMDSHLTRSILGIGVAVLTASQLGAAQANGTASASIDRSLVDKYCVTCHNEKLKTGNLALDKVDLSNVKANADVLEKVVRKLRSHQMPPDGMPRPDQSVMDGFAATLETSLDRVAGLQIQILEESRRTV